MAPQGHLWVSTSELWQLGQPGKGIIKEDD
jgi:hypothetical protein